MDAMTDIHVQGKEIWVQQNRHSSKPWAAQSCDVANVSVNSGWDPVWYFHPPDKVVSGRVYTIPPIQFFLFKSVASTRLSSICSH